MAKLYQYTGRWPASRKAIANTVAVTIAVAAFAAIAIARARCECVCSDNPNQENKQNVEEASLMPGFVVVDSHKDLRVVGWLPESDS